MSKRFEIRTLLWFVVVVATFGAVGFLSLHTGDDLGYMFTDTVHHNGDGVRVTTFAQIIDTQMHHWHTTNGRVVVHTVVMAMLNLVPLWLYRTINTLMFGLLWLCSVRCATPRSSRPGAWLCALAWLGLWLALPQPALLFTTLVAYAVNYMWVSVAILAFLLLIRRKTNILCLCPAAFLVALLHEGASLPVLCGLAVAAFWGRTVKWPVVICFFAGTALCAIAPGNLAHAAQGADILAKLSALGLELTHSIMTLLLVIMALWAVRNRRAAWRFVRRNIVMCTAIAASLAMAAVTFTAPRQLMLPSIFALILVLKILAQSHIRKPRLIAPAACTLTLLIVGGVFAARVHVYTKYQGLMDYTAKGKPVVYSPGSTPDAYIDRTDNALLAAYAPDPLLNRGLMAMGDRYTIQGLQRTVSKKLLVILPYETDVVIAAADTVFRPIYGADSTKMQLPMRRIGPFSVATTPPGARWKLDCNPSPRAVFFRNDRRFFLTPPRKTLKFKRL